MRGRLLRVGLCGLVWACAALGCHKSLVQHKDPPDPLLVTKKPVEGRPRASDSQAAWNEPNPPPVPTREPLPVTVQRGPALPTLAGSHGPTPDPP
jgi:hypothetical protein